MEDLGAKETVIIVHGTWAAPKDDDPDQADPKTDQPDHVNWYQIPPDGQPNFVSKLNKALERRGSPARCWAHCKDNSEIFSWSGDNAWIARTHAASDLAAKLNALQADGWRCHVVAHSHGGNIIVEALPQIQRPPDKPTGLSGTITTLGTPFIDVMSPIMERVRRQLKHQIFTGIAVVFLIALYLVIHETGVVWTLKTISILTILLGIPVMTFVIGPVLARKFQNLDTPPRNAQPLWKNWKDIGKNWKYFGKRKDVTFSIIFTSSFLMYSAISLWLMLFVAPKEIVQLAGKLTMLLVVFLAPALTKKDDDHWSKYWKSSVEETSPRVLCIGSSMDEAWQVLHDVRKISNPLAPDAGLFSFVLRNRRAYLERCSDIERIQGVVSDKFSNVVQSIMIGGLVFGIVSTLVSTVGGGIVTSTVAMIAILFILASIFDKSPELSTFRWIVKQLRATGRIFYDIGTFMARSWSWSLLQEVAFGLEGYRLELPEASQKLTFASSTIYKYEDLPEGAEQRALARRDEWVKRAFGDVTQTLSKMATPDLRPLLEMIETDLSLVHAAYYTDDECIERIADWIAGKARSVEVEGASSETVRLAS